MEHHTFERKTRQHNPKSASLKSDGDGVKLITVSAETPTECNSTARYEADHRCQSMGDDASFCLCFLLNSLVLVSFPFIGYPLFLLLSFFCFIEGMAIEVYHADSRLPHSRIISKLERKPRNSLEATIELFIFCPQYPIAI